MKTLNLILSLCLHTICFSQEISFDKTCLGDKDAEVWSYQQIISNGGIRESSNFYTWTRDGDVIQKRSLLEFSLDDLPEPELLIEAELSLFFNPTDQYESFTEHTGDNQFFIERIITSWEEDSVWWQNQPLITELNRVEVEKSEFNNQDYLSIDVRELVRDMLEDPDNSFGFRLRMINETEPYRMCILASSDHPNQLLHPCLRLVFDQTSSFDENIHMDEDLLLFPNPVLANEFIFVKGKLNENLNFELINLEGKIIQKGVISQQNKRLKIGNYNSGPYFIKLWDGKNVSMKKLLIQH